MAIVLRAIGDASSQQLPFFKQIHRNVGVRLTQQLQCKSRSGEAATDYRNGTFIRAGRGDGIF
jgi:hypothetical protein